MGSDPAGGSAALVFRRTPPLRAWPEPLLDR
jgi:hypothetical protein